MTELKTLKDIGLEDFPIPNKLEVDVDEYNERLRAEAVKHIEYLGKQNVVSLWIKSFFNLDEEENMLKKMHPLVPEEDLK